MGGVDLGYKHTPASLKSMDHELLISLVSRFIH